MSDENSLDLQERRTVLGQVNQYPIVTRVRRSSQQALDRLLDKPTGTYLVQVHQHVIVDVREVEPPAKVKASEAPSQTQVQAEEEEPKARRTSKKDDIEQKE